MALSLFRENVLGQFRASVLELNVFYNYVLIWCYQHQLPEDHFCIDSSLGLVLKQAENLLTESHSGRTERAWMANLLRVVNDVWHCHFFKRMCSDDFMYPWFPGWELFERVAHAHELPAVLVKNKARLCRFCLSHHPPPVDLIQLSI